MKIILSENQIKQLLKEGYREINELASLSKEILYYFLKLNPNIFQDFFNRADNTSTWDESLIPDEPRISHYLIDLVTDISKYPILKAFIYRWNPIITFTDEIDSRGTYNTKYMSIFKDKDKIRKEIKIRINREYFNVTYALNNIKEKITPQIKKEFIKDYLISWSDTLMHELQHAYDDFRSGGKYDETREQKRYSTNDGILSDKEKEDIYLKIPHEYWARFSSTASNLDIKNKSFPDIWNDFKINFIGYDVLDSSVRERLMKALYKFYDLNK